MNSQLLSEDGKDTEKAYHDIMQAFSEALEKNAVKEMTGKYLPSPEKGSPLFQAALAEVANYKKAADPKAMTLSKRNITVLCKYLFRKALKHSPALEKTMKEAERILSKRGNDFTLKKDAMISATVKKQGKDAFLEVKKDNFNIKLEEFVTGADQRNMVEIVDDRLVARSGIIYLTPHNKFGRAPFYSSEKILGSWHIKTLWFNLGVICLMSLIAIILLLTDCPGKYMRKEQ